VRESAALKVLAALSPIATAQADTLPATRPMPRRNHRNIKNAPVVAVARRDRHNGKGAPVVLARRNRHNSKSAPVVARRAGTCPRPGAHADTCPHRTTKLADRTGKKKPPSLAPA